MSEKQRNVNAIICEEVYQELKAHCKENGLLLSKFVEKSILQQLKKEKK